MNDDTKLVDLVRLAKRKADTFNIQNEDGEESDWARARRVCEQPQ